MGEAGQGGAGTTKLMCKPDMVRCGGDTMKTPEICSKAGEWVPNTSENEGDECPVLCSEGMCLECGAGETKCNGNIPQSCEDGAWKDGTVCAAYCLDGACRNPPSCAPLPECQPDCSTVLDCPGQTSCCQATEVPGGTFTRDFDGVVWADDRFKASLSSFLLDRYEVTVGRLRRFVDAYPSIVLAAGDGKSPHIAEDNGWNPTYELPASADDLKTLLKCPNTTWTDDPGDNELLPANCVNFFVAYAFCIWDGGRLPTEAEWNYAAAGGDEQRVYPWSAPPGDTTITEAHAFFGQADGLPLPVGSKPDGKGRWGQDDLAGNIYELTLDFYVEAYASEQCNDCLTATGSGERSIRGGAYRFYEEYLMVADRTNTPFDQTLVRDFAGFRCAHDLPPQN